MIDLKDLGLSKKELQERVIDRAVERLLSVETGEDSDAFDPDFAAKLNDAVKDRVDKAVMKIADEHIQPHVKDYIEKVEFRETNRYGEQQKAPLTFREYLVKLAEGYLTEMVNYEGKPRNQDGYSWTGKQTRIAWMIDKHLQYHIESAMKDALADLNSKVAQGLAETVKIKIAETLAALKVSVTK